MSDKLIPILDAKRRLVAERKAATPLSVLSEQAAAQTPTRGFAAALRRRTQSGRYGLIAEMKRASPSKGLIRPDFDPAGLASAYRAGGAACLSVLTDTPYFHGHDEDLMAARAAVDLPVLRKDFIVDEYQIVESRALGADCILLIMAALSDNQAADYMGLAQSLGMDSLVEIHDGEELDRALPLKPQMVGINNRNLKTLLVDLETSCRLAGRLPGDVLAVSESGLASPADLALVAKRNIFAFLIGESLLRNADIEHATRTLLVDRP